MASDWVFTTPEHESVSLAIIENLFQGRVPGYSPRSYEGFGKLSVAIDNNKYQLTDRPTCFKFLSSNDVLRGLFNDLNEQLLLEVERNKGRWPFLRLKHFMESGVKLFINYGENSLQVTSDTSTPQQLIFTKGVHGERLLQYHAKIHYIGQTSSRETSLIIEKIRNEIE